MKNRYEVNGETTTIYIKSKGEIIEAIIDTDDLDKIIKFNATWSINWRPDGQKYVKTNGRGGIGRRKFMYLHQFICKADRGHVVDHINRNPLDNRKSNLRSVTFKENVRNSSRVNNEYVGVTWHKQTRRWRADIRVNGRMVTLGRYRDKEDARIARQEAESKLTG